MTSRIQLLIHFFLSYFHTKIQILNDVEYSKSGQEYPCDRSKVLSPKRQDTFETKLKITRKQKEQRQEMHEAVRNMVGIFKTSIICNNSHNLIKLCTTFVEKTCNQILLKSLFFF